VWLFLQDFLQATLASAPAWKLVLGLVFVILVLLPAPGIIGGCAILQRLVTRASAAPRAARLRRAAAASRAPIADAAHRLPNGTRAGSWRRRPHQALRRVAANEASTSP
jgi:hypothetical protein